jgi:hypothetical protein
MDTKAFISSLLTKNGLKADNHAGNTEKEINGYVVFIRKIHRSEPVFLNVYGAPEFIPRNEFR